MRRRPISWGPGSEIEKNEPITIVESPRKFISGEFGLATTVWAFWVLPGIPLAVGVYISLAEAGGWYTSTRDWLAIAITTHLFLLHQIPCLVGAWRAAEAYTGPGRWKVATKVAVAIAATISELVLLIAVTAGLALVLGP